MLNDIFCRERTTSRLWNHKAKVVFKTIALLLRFFFSHFFFTFNGQRFNILLIVATKVEIDFHTVLQLRLQYYSLLFMAIVPRGGGGGGDVDGDGGGGSEVVIDVKEGQNVEHTVD